MRHSCIIVIEIQKIITFNLNGIVNI